MKSFLKTNQIPYGMNSTLIKKEGTLTAFVRLNINTCTACWECIDSCPDKVMDKSFLYIANSLILKHVFMYKADECSGCMNCINACKFNAISIIE